MLREGRILVDITQLTDLNINLEKGRYLEINRQFLIGWSYTEGGISSGLLFGLISAQKTGLRSRMELRETAREESRSRSEKCNRLSTVAGKPSTRERPRATEVPERDGVTICGFTGKGLSCSWMSLPSDSLRCRDKSKISIHRHKDTAQGNFYALTGFHFHQERTGRIATIMSTGRLLLRQNSLHKSAIGHKTKLESLWGPSKTPRDWKDFISLQQHAFTTAKPIPRRPSELHISLPSKDHFFSASWKENFKVCVFVLFYACLKVLWNGLTAGTICLKLNTVKLEDCLSFSHTKHLLVTDFLRIVHTELAFNNSSCSFEPGGLRLGSRFLNQLTDVLARWFAFVAHSQDFLFFPCRFHHSQNCLCKKQFLLLDGSRKSRVLSERGLSLLSEDNPPRTKCTGPWSQNAHARTHVRFVSKCTRSMFKLNNRPPANPSCRARLHFTCKYHHCREGTKQTRPPRHWMSMKRPLCHGSRQTPQFSNGVASANIRNAQRRKWTVFGWIYCLTGQNI